MLRLITIRGAQWLTIANLTLSDTSTKWQGYMGSAGSQLRASASGTTAGPAGWPDCAVTIEDGSQQITLSRLSFANLGGCGVIIRDEVVEMTVERSLFSGVAAHGIMVFGNGQDPAPGGVPREIHIMNNVMRNLGTLFSGSGAIEIQGSMFGEVRRNRITDLPHSAIGLGGSLRRPEALATNYVVAENVVADTNKETDDTGAIVVYVQQKDDLRSNESFVDQSILCAHQYSNMPA